MNDTSEKLIAELQREGAQSQGVFRLILFDRTSIPGLARRHHAGDKSATMWLRTIDNTIDNQRSPPACICCKRSIDDPKEAHTLAFVVPAKEDPTVSLAAWVCAGCATPENLMQRVYDAMSPAFGGGRILNVSGQVGHA